MNIRFPTTTRCAELLPMALLASSVLLGCFLSNGCGDDDSSASNNNNGGGILDRQQALAACLVTDACGVMPFLYASLCLEASWDQQYHSSTIPIWNDLYRCALAQAGDCAGVRACFGGGAEPVFCQNATEGYCDGDKRVYCDTMDDRLYTLDCALANQVCRMAEVAVGILAPVCAAGPCVGDPDPGECRGNMLISCDQDVRYLRDCASLGLVCGESLTGSKACAGDGAPCDSFTHEPSCEGAVVTRCMQNRLDTLDCGILPGDKTCEPGHTDCVPAGTQCEPGQESCQGSLIRVCLDGSIHQVDCLDLGFSRCELRSGGAHCRP